MTVTQHELDSFHQFATNELNNGGSGLSMDDLYDQWRALHPTPAELAESVAAVRAALQDYENGDRGRPAEEVLREIRAKYNLDAG